MGTTLTIGSRGSDLALWQARYVQSLLKVPSTIEVIKTQGDLIDNTDLRDLREIDGKGFFTKEIEQALLVGDIDIAVHSFKDLPIENPTGLEVTSVPQRAAVNDMVVSKIAQKSFDRVWHLPLGARVGTSSLRRKAQLLHKRPDLQVIDIRGNVPTRLKKATSFDLDAVVLAQAGLERLGLLTSLADLGLFATPLSVHDMVPAPAQGALAIQVRRGDQQTIDAVGPLHHDATAIAAHTERQLLGRFGGGCQLPLGAYCYSLGGDLDLTAVVVAPDGREILRTTVRGQSAAPLVEKAYRELVAQGASRYIVPPQNL